MGLDVTVHQSIRPAGAGASKVGFPPLVDIAALRSGHESSVRSSKHLEIVDLNFDQLL